MFFQLALPFSPVFYRWLLGQEHFLTAADVAHLDADLSRTLRALARAADEKRRIEADASLATPQQRLQAIQASRTVEFWNNFKMLCFKPKGQRTPPTVENKMKLKSLCWMGCGLTNPGLLCQLFIVDFSLLNSHLSGTITFCFLCVLLNSFLASTLLTMDSLAN